MDDFDRWTIVKRKISLKHLASTTSPKEREVWVCTLGLNIGSEENGKGNNFQRPVLILKVFDSNMCWVIPLSTKQKRIHYYYNFLEPKGTKASAILSQLRLISIKRLTRKLYDMPVRDFDRICNKTAQYIRKTPYKTGIFKRTLGNLNRSSPQVKPQHLAVV